MSLIGLAALVALASALPEAPGPARSRFAPTEAPADAPLRHLRARYEVRNTTDATVTGAHLHAFAPVVVGPTQRLVVLSVSRDATLETDALGNGVVTVALPPLPPRGLATVTITATVALDAGGAGPAPTRRDLAAEPLIEVDAPEIAALAAALPPQGPTATARAAYDTVRALVARAGYSAADLGAAHALAAGHGDCTEQAYLLVALARAAGLPARVVGGFVVDRSVALSAERYHNWAEVRIDSGWRVVDPHGGAFDDRSGRYIATNRGGLATPGPLRGHHRYRVDHEALTVRIVGGGR